ncbi:MAG: AAA family ATPase [Deferribacteraceae bacterium]|jgi:predicted ATPase|nr:AAA family ATPase [Deferribacteraceae bacterium]
MIEKLYINNYRNFVNCTIDFNKDFTLLCGKNGTGKTAIAELIYKLTSFITDSMSASNLVSYNDLPRWNIEKENNQADIELTIQTSSGLFKYSINIAYTKENNAHTSYIAAESLSFSDIFLYQFDGAEEKVSMLTDDKGELQYPSNNTRSNLQLAAKSNSKIKNFFHYCKTQVYSLSFIGNSSKFFATDRLSFGGDDFQVWYSAILPKKTRQIAQTIKEYEDFIPNLEDVIVGDMSELVFIEKNSTDSYKINFRELSTGQQKLCIYYFLLNIAEKGSTIILDELESHLSPAELYPLYHKMQTVADERDVQFIIISHNPKTLNWYHKEAIVFSTTGVPTFVRAEQFDYKNAQSSLFEYVGD